MAFDIFLSPPHMGGKELEYVQEAFQSNWIAPYGPFINQFEEKMADYIGVADALAVSSGTAAIHLVFRWLGIGEGDVVFCSDFTFIGSCDPVFYERAVPVFIDCEPDSWNMSPAALERAFQDAKKEGNMPKAVLVVDLYGESADWDSILPICRKYGVPVIEDAAEAVGALYKGKRCGSFGDFAVHSYNGNKIITTSGGGMVLSHNRMAIEKMRFWSTQAREPMIHYEHKEYGYNYRMSNICAAIGLGQLEFLEEKIRIRKKMHQFYAEALKGIPGYIKEHTEKNASNCWLNLLYITDNVIAPEEVVLRLQNAGIEARPAWKPMHMQPVFHAPQFYPHSKKQIVDEDVFSHAICLPSGDSMTDKQLERVIHELRKCFG
ncbi:MAG: aminotransferase class I/II-fold pyridoxal phosphate-dependent enzyme [Clostridiales bacterium]|nr:aminotransferase class I/II-fold pyridoxal phosphate-dependent enzyme [Clostridiales bacterium]